MDPQTSSNCPFQSAISNGNSPSHAATLASQLTLPISDFSTVSLPEACQFFHDLAKEGDGFTPEWEARYLSVVSQIGTNQHYQKTAAELAAAARMAWRNSIRCIGRQHWRSLAVRDMRHLTAPGDVFESIIEHLKLSSNGGEIKPLISIFTRENHGKYPLRIINRQIIRYAAYRCGSKIQGDPANLAFTDLAIRLGWRPPHPATPFDILPVVISDSLGKLHLFPLPNCPSTLKEVLIGHPEFPWFQDLGMRWHAIPAISDMILDAGGLKYPANVFNGWYMSTEIACRNLGDVNRYDFLPRIAAGMGLDVSSDRNLWKDKALMELNVAVLDSFERASIRMVDHHTASRQFIDFTAREEREGREVFGDWSWLVPPLSGSTSPIFHRSYAETVVKPGFFYSSES